MKRSTRVFAWVAALVIFLLTLALSAAWLPDRVATHFNSAGQPDAWMSRSRHLLLFGAFGIFFSGFFVAVFYVIRFLPASLLNVSNARYWRSPEHYPEACEYLFQQSFPMATMATLFVTGIHLLIVRANLPPQPQMELGPTLTLAGGFLLGMVVWIFSWIRFFRHIDRVP